jgi:hypothetical protein
MFIPPKTPTIDETGTLTQETVPQAIAWDSGKVTDILNRKAGVQVHTSHAAGTSTHHGRAIISSSSPAHHRLSIRK